MADSLPPHMREALADALAASLEAPLPSSTERRVSGPVRLPNKATAIIGMRRAGKTTYLHQLRRERLASGTPRSFLPYINFEDERLAALEARHLGFLLDEFVRRVPEAGTGATVVWSFDEIQNVPGWERFVRRMLDAGGAEVVVTGSSASLLSREIGTALRGRAWTVAMYPFSYAEAQAHQGWLVPEDPSALTGRQRARIEGAFLRWLEEGGFPEAQGLDARTRAQLLRDYVDVAILRDVVERHGVSNLTGLRWLVRHLLGNAGCRFSIEKFHHAVKSQGIAVGRDTLHDYLAHLEDCFLVHTVWMESDSERQRMVNPRKAYPVDAGLIPLYDCTGRANLGHALETAVLVELLRRRCEVTYVRTGDDHEVDFLACDAEGQRHLVQVCARAADPSTAARELRALDEAAARYPDAKRTLLVLTRDDLPPETPAGVTGMTAWEWMLAGDTTG